MILLSVDFLVIVFSKQLANYQKILADFNQGLKLLREAGKVEAIMKKHGIH